MAAPSPPPRLAARRLLNRKLLEFPSRREIYRAYGIYVAEKTPRFTPPACLPPPPTRTAATFHDRSIFLRRFPLPPFLTPSKMYFYPRSSTRSSLTSYLDALSLLFYEIHKPDTNRFLARDPSRSGKRRYEKGLLPRREKSSSRNFHLSLSLSPIFREVVNNFRTMASQQPSRRDAATTAATTTTRGRGGGKEKKVVINI